MNKNIDRGMLSKIVRLSAIYSVEPSRLSAALSQHTEPHGIRVTRKNAARLIRQWLSVA
jgi:hypothetical protein